VYKVLVGKPKGKIQLRRPKCRWEDAIRKDLSKIGWGEGGGKWIQLAQDRDWWQALVNMAMSICVPASQI
jgi:hypothetical protein